MSYLVTYTGRFIDPINPNPRDINLEDIAHALSSICRFGGHTKLFYSVAEHSVRVADLVSEENRLWAFLHDASEAYFGDLIAPIKHLKDFAFFRDIEDNLMGTICDRFRMDYECPKEVKEADLIMRGTEMRDLTDWPESEWSKWNPIATKVVPVSQESAKVWFLSYARMLGVE